MAETANKITVENYDYKALGFQDRQAGISLIYDPVRETFTYNAYCIEKKLLAELYTCEFDFLDDALELINSEFGTWDLIDLTKKKTGCSSCAAKPH